jgi:hypothetical protein
LEDFKMEVTERLRQLVEFMARSILDDEHPLKVHAVNGAENIVLEVSCSPDDIGLLIGRNGRVIESIRTIVRAACRGEHIRITVEVLNSRN